MAPELLRTLCRPVRAVLALAILASLSGRVHAAVTWPSDFDEEVIASGLENPTALAYAPDGRIFIAEKAGRVRVIDASGNLLPGSFTTVAVTTDDDLGLIGITLDPDFVNNHFVYLAYTTTIVPPNPATIYSRIHRITRWTADGDVAIPGSEVIIVDNIASDHTSHVGGALRFGPDGKLYVTVGDGASYNIADPLALRALDLGSINGKVLRINPDGSAPADNPYVFTPGADPRVWLRGLRNPFKATFRPGTNKLYIDDVGWNTWEEVNLGVAGANFGWPCFEGDGQQQQYQQAFHSPCSGFTPNPPLYTYQHDANGGAVIGGAFFEGSNYPAQYVDKYFIADYAQHWIKYVTLTSNDGFVSITNFASGDSLFVPVEVAMAPDGNLHYLNITTDYTIPSGTLNRIVYVGAGNHAPRPVASASPSSGYAPLSVTLSGVGTTDVDNDPLSYHWLFGDGQQGDGQIVQHTYVADGTYIATLQVNDTLVIREAKATVTVGSLPPTATISTPAFDKTFVDNETINYSGFATDPDEGDLGPNALHWTVIQHHNTHEHHYSESIGPTGSFIALDHGTTSDVFYYEIVLTATDASGLSDSKSINIYPNHGPIADAGRDQAVTCAMNPLVMLDGRASHDPDNTPFTYAWTQLSGPSVVLDGASTATPKFTAPVVAGGTSLTFQLMVADGQSPTTDTVAITVPDLTDADGDQAPACRDCAPANAASRPPTEVTGLAFSSKTAISWNSVPGATAYDVERGLIWSPWVYNHDCATQGVTQTTATVSGNPPAGAAYYYLVRGTSLCGLGDIGGATDGRPATNAACGSGGAPGQITVNFNDQTANTPLNGEYPVGLIDWGTGNWLLSGPWQLFTTNSASFNGAGPTSGGFQFGTPRILISVRAYNGGSVTSTVTLSCDGNAQVQMAVPAGQIVTIPTNWTKACTNAVVGSTNGWNTNFDDLVVY